MVFSEYFFPCSLFLSFRIQTQKISIIFGPWDKAYTWGGRAEGRRNLLPFGQEQYLWTSHVLVHERTCLNSCCWSELLHRQIYILTDTSSSLKCISPFVLMKILILEGPKQVPLLLPAYLTITLFPWTAIPCDHMRYVYHTEGDWFQ